MEYIDLALDYLKDHRFVAAIIAIVFLILLIRNFWFLIKMLVILALGLLAVVLLFSFIGKAKKEKEDLLKPEESSRLQQLRPVTAEWSHHASYRRLGLKMPSARFVKPDLP